MNRFRRHLREIVLWLLIFAIPFDTKKFIWSATATVTEYHGIFVYGTDILLLLSLVFWGFRNVEWKSKYAKILAIFALLALLPVFWAVSPLLALYGWLRLVLLIAFALGLASLVRNEAVKLKTIFSAIFASAVFQGIVALLQFRDQASLGLKLLGESVIGPATTGVARVAAAGITFLRSYGTMPHANILAAFIGFGLIAAVHLFYGARTFKARLGFAAGFFLMLAALLFTFSRSGWIVAGLTLAALVIYGLWREGLRTRAVPLVLVLIAGAAFVLPSMSWLVFPRASFTSGEPSVADRLAYDRIGLSKFPETYPLGVGLKNQVLTAVQNDWYNAFGLKYAFQAQPIHNVYLLMMAETGIMGLVAFLVFVVVLFYEKFWAWLKTKDGDIWFALVLTAGALAFGLVDHFYWDLWPGQLMFWLALGILMGVSARSSTDRAYPSEG